MIDGISMEMLERFDQIVIELHDFILSDWENKNRIIRALEKLSH